MNPKEIFVSYAGAFEEALKSNRWRTVASFFAEDAVYESSGCKLFEGSWRGRDAIVAQLKKSLDGFDRRFDSREPMLLSLEEEGGCVSLHCGAIYRLGNHPELRLECEERAWVEGGKIVRLADMFSPDASQAIVAFAEEHLFSKQTNI